MAKEFIVKLINEEFDKLNENEIQVILNNNSIFGVSSKTAKKYSKLVKTNKEEVVKIIEQEMYHPFYILERLDSAEIDEFGLKIQFKKDFYLTLSKMDNYKFCLLIDRMGYLMKGFPKVRFFGGTQRRASAYHEINAAFGLVNYTKMSFKIFVKGELGNYKHFNYNRVNRYLMVQCLDKWISHHYFLLNELATLLLSTTPEDEIDKNKFTKYINKELRYILDMITNEPVGRKEHGITADRSYAAYIEKYFEFDEDEED